MKKILASNIIVAIFFWNGLQAQTPMLTDGMMMPQKAIGGGAFYSNDGWKNYWEGSLKRDNQNIGTLTTKSVTAMVAYGLKEKITLIAMLPYVSTSASGGTLHGLKGWQDITIAAKYNYVNKTWGENTLRMFVQGAYSMPVSSYTPDFLPMSIGVASKTLSGRTTTTFALKKTWLFTASGAYTYRSNIFLNRPSYYTNGQMYYSNEVQMYDQIDFIVRAGYHREKWHGELFYTQLNTLGGGDIASQDMPFASNRMNYCRIGVSLMGMVPHVKNLAARVWSSYTTNGRNVGQSTTVTAGLFYTFQFSNPQM